MANIVEFLVKMRDSVSGPMQALARNTEGSFNRIAAKVNTTGSSVDQLNAKITALTKTREMSIDTSQLRRTGRELDALERKRDRLQNMGRSGGMGMMGGTMLFAGIAAVGALGSEFIQAGVDRQISKIALETFAGKKPGDLLNDQLVGYATKSIYGNEIMSEGKLLAGGGVKANNIMPIMHMLGDLGAGDKEHMKSLALAFSEASSTGHFTGRQEMMMRTALFNPLEALSAITHKSSGELEKDMQKGKISIDMLVHAMEYATGPMGRWNNMENKIAGDGSGKWIAFKGALTTLAGTIGTSLLPALGGLSNFMTGIITNKAALWSIAAGIGAMTVAWIGYTSVVKGAAIWAAILEAFTSPWMAIAGIGIATAAVAATFIGNSDAMGDSAMNAANKIDKANGKITNSTDAMAAKLQNLNSQKGGFWSGIGDWMGEALKDIWWWVQKVIINVAQIGYEIWEAFRGLSKIRMGLYSDGWKDIKAALIGDPGGDPLQKFITNLDEKHDLHKKLRGAGKNDDGTPLGSDGVNPLSPGKYTPTGTPGGTPDGVSDTAKGIAGGGVRNLTINIAKQGIDQITLHVATLKEGKEEIQDMFINMFNQVVNSGNAAVSPN